MKKTKVHPLTGIQKMIEAKKLKEKKEEQEEAMMIAKAIKGRK